MQIVKARGCDTERVEQIYSMAREFMRSSGNPDQWGATYPPHERIVADIEAGRLYLVMDGEHILAVFYFAVERDATYARITDGAWLDNGEYAVIHRVAVARQGRGLARCIFEYCLSQHQSLRIDTHRDNIPMQRALEHFGFSRCGIIFTDDGSERIAYQLVREK